MVETIWFRISDKIDDNQYVTEVILIQFENDGEFWVKENGRFGIILDNVLIDNTLAMFLENYVYDQVNISSCKVLRRATNEVWTNYSTLGLINELDVNDFHKSEKDVEGYKIFWFNEGIFVNADLKNLLEEKFEKVDQLEFDNTYPFLV